jgi:hypothetical protein
VETRGEGRTNQKKVERKMVVSPSIYPSLVGYLKVHPWWHFNSPTGGPDLKGYPVEQEINSRWRSFLLPNTLCHKRPSLGKCGDQDPKTSLDVYTRLSEIFRLCHSVHFLHEKQALKINKLYAQMLPRAFCTPSHTPKPWLYRWF